MPDTGKEMEFHGDHDDMQTDDPEAVRQRIFDERFHALMDKFGKSCDKHNVDVAIAIADHPDEDVPLVFMRGDIYKTAALLAHVLRNMKAKILRDLDTDVFEQR